MKPEERRIGNRAQEKIGVVGFYPSVMKDGQILFAVPKNKPARLYIKTGGRKWWINLTKDDKQYIEKLLTVNRIFCPTIANINTLHINGIEAIDSNGYQQSGLKTRQSIQFGVDATLTTTDDWLHGAGGCDPGIVTLRNAGKITGMSLSVTSAIVQTTGDTEATTVFEAYLDDAGDNSFTAVGELVILPADNGNFSKSVSLDIDVEAGDRLKVYYNYSPGIADTVSFVKPQIMVEYEA